MKIKEILIGIRDWALGKLSAKQDVLVSGENIKSINNESLLGEGNISIPTESDIVWEKGTGTNSVQQKGTGATASGSNSFATGNQTISKAIYSHAEGNSTQSHGTSSHSEGSYTIAAGHSSHAEGFGTRAGNLAKNSAIADLSMGYFSHAEGNGTLAKGNSSHAEGKGTQAIGLAAHVEGGDNLEGGEPGDGEELLYAIAEGYASHAEGAAHAIGRYSHAEGGGNSIEEGHPTRSTAEGAYSHAEGTHTHAIGNGSHAEGHLTIAKSAASHAEGRLTVAGVGASVGRYAHAEGFSSKATGENSHAEGNATNATGANSHSEGSNNTASGESSHTEGAQTSASANHSHAGGFASEVSSPRGFVHGRNVEAKSNVEGQFAVGKYNKSNTNQILSVGIGTGTFASQRKNAFEIMQNGDAYFYGVGTYNGTNPTSGTNDLKTILNNKKNRSEIIVTSFSPFNNVSYTVRASDNQTLNDLAALIAASGYEAKALNFLEFTTDDNYEAICLQEDIDECKFVRISSRYNMEDGSTKTTYLYDNPADNIRKILTIVITIDNNTREFDSASFELKDAPTSGSGTEPLFVDCNYDPYNHTIDGYSDVEVPFQEVATAFDSGRPVIFRDGANEFSGLLIACHNGAGWGSCAVGSPDGIVTISIT